MLSERIELAMAQGKLTVAELADIFGVTRPTVYSWRNGGGGHAIFIRRANSVLDLIDTAVEAGRLPLPAGIAHMNRRAALIEALKASR